MSASAGRVLLIPKGEWNSTTEYSNLDIVHHNTSTWVCKKTCIGVEPSDAQTSYWQAMAKDATEQIATTSTNGLMSASDKTKLNSIAAKAEVNVQSDWSVTDTSSDAYIKNKPTIDSAISTTSTNAIQNKAVTAELNKKVNAVSGKGLSTNDYTTAEKTKLSKIADGAEVNVQSDWSVTDTSSDAYIKNKPSLDTKVDDTAEGANSLLSKMGDTWTATPTDDTNFIRQDTGGGNIFGRVKFSTLWEYIKSKLTTATTSADGLMSATDKTKLDSVPKLDYTSVFSDNSKHEIDFTGTAGTSMYMQSLYTPTDVNAYTHAKIGLVNTSTYPSVHSKCIQEYYNQGYILRTEIKQTMTNVNIIAYKYADLGVKPTSASYQFNSSNFFSDLANGLGTSSYPWSNIYSKTAVTVTSDRNKKKDIQDISTDRAIELIKHLKPSTYKLIDGTSDRTHYGMIAQDVEEMLTELGMDSKDFAGFIKSPKEEIDKETGKSTVVEGEYDYMLRYEEFIAPLISTVQNLMDRVEVLEAKLKELEG